MCVCVCVCVCALNESTCAHRLTTTSTLLVSPSAEGDRKASKETAGAKIEGNKRRIAALRDENKALVSQLRVLKNPGKQKFGAGVSMKAVNIMDEKVCALIKKHNQVRADALRKEKELLRLQKEMFVVPRPPCE